jgi:deoxyribonuclease (pyrimidine dimer)
MVPQSLRRTLNSKTGFSEKRIPDSYTLNKGHVYFFYDKLSFLQKRYNQIIKELKIRGVNLDPNRDSKLSGLPEQFYNNYTPDKEAENINFERILLRINQKPSFYHYYGKGFYYEAKKQKLLKRYKGNLKWISS